MKKLFFLLSLLLLASCGSEVAKQTLTIETDCAPADLPLLKTQLKKRLLLGGVDTSQVTFADKSAGLIEVTMPEVADKNLLNLLLTEPGGFAIYELVPVWEWGSLLMKADSIMGGVSATDSDSEKPDTLGLDEPIVGEEHQTEEERNKREHPFLSMLIMKNTLELEDSWTMISVPLANLKPVMEILRRPEIEALFKGKCQLVAEAPMGGADTLTFAGLDSRWDPLINETMVSKAEVKKMDWGLSLEVKLDQRGAIELEKISSRNQNEPLGIVCGGELITMPMMRGPLEGGAFSISGSFTRAELDNLAVRIQMEKLPAAVRVK